LGFWNEAAACHALDDVELDLPSFLGCASSRLEGWQDTFCQFLDSYSQTACDHFESSANLSELSHYLLWSTESGKVDNQLYWACGRVDKSELVDQAFAAAIAFANLRKPAPLTKALQYCMCMHQYFHSRYEDIQHQAAQFLLQEDRIETNTYLMDSGVHVTNSPSHQTLHGFAEICFARAVAGEKAGGDPSFYIQRLAKVLARIRTSRTAAHSVSDTSTNSIQVTYQSLSFRFPALLLGRWYHEHGNLANAQLYFWPFISAALDMLTDDTLLNDEMGFTHLSEGLLQMGDVEGWEAAMRLRYTRIVGQPGQAGMSLSNPVRSESERQYSDPVRFCDSCQRDVSFAEGMNHSLGGHFDADLCDECLASLRAGRLPERRWATDTTFVKFGLFGLPDVPYGKVRFGGLEGKAGELMDLKDWYDQIRTKWRPQEAERD
jgi:hypothetical protein